MASAEDLQHLREALFDEYEADLQEPNNYKQIPNEHARYYESKVKFIGLATPTLRATVGLVPVRDEHYNDLSLTPIVSRDVVHREPRLTFGSHSALDWRVKELATRGFAHYMYHAHLLRNSIGGYKQLFIDAGRSGIEHVLLEDLSVKLPDTHILTGGGHTEDYTEETVYALNGNTVAIPNAGLRSRLKTISNDPAGAMREIDYILSLQQEYGLSDEQTRYLAMQIYSNHINRVQMPHADLCRQVLENKQELD